MRKITGPCLVLALAACSSTPQLDGVEVVWPPASAGAPADVLWRGDISFLTPRGAGKIFRALAGAGSSEQRGRFSQPISVASCGNRIFVVDTALQEVIGCGLDGRSAERLPLPGDFFPVAVAGGNDRVLVADRSTGSVLAFDANGSPQGVAIAAGSVARCGGLAVCANGDILLTDAELGQVVRFTATGREIGRVGRSGSDQGEFNSPTAVVEAPDETVWVLDTFNFRVQQLDDDLEPIGGFGDHGDGTGQIALGKGLAVDPDGHLYISDARFDVIQVFDSTGRLLFVVGKHGRERGEFWNPAGISCDERGMITVADTGNRRVQLLRYRRKGDSS